MSIKQPLLNKRKQSAVGGDLIADQSAALEEKMNASMVSRVSKKSRKTNAGGEGTSNMAKSFAATKGRDGKTASGVAAY